MVSEDIFTAHVPVIIEEDRAFIEWQSSADGSLFDKVEAAKEKIKNEGVVTSAKYLNDGLYEKKWHSGLRLYFAVIENNRKKTLLLLGSGKGRDQNKAIKKARDILKGYSVIKENIVKKD